MTIEAMDLSMYPNIEVKYKPHDQSDFVSNSSSRILYDVPCKVCGDFSSGKHYGIFACDGCAGFFKRSIRRGRDYPCKGRDTQCVIDKTHRNQCRGCRLRRCVEVGMNREAVQHERGPRNATIRKQMTDIISARQLNPATFTPFHPLPRPGFYPFLPLPHMKLEQVDGNRNVSVKNERISPLSSPEVIKSSPTLSAPSSPASSYRAVVCEKAAQILFMNSKWAKSFPTFQMLPSKDKVLLFQHSWVRLFVLGCVQVLTQEDLENMKSEKISGAEMSSFLSSVQGLQSIGLSAAELGFLRGVILFKHGSEILDKMETSRDIIAAVADHTHVALAQSMMIRTENNPLQLAKMMMILAGLENINSAFIHQLFFRDQAGLADVNMDVIVVDMLSSK